MGDVGARPRCPAQSGPGPGGRVGRVPRRSEEPPAPRGGCSAPAHACAPHGACSSWQGRAQPPLATGCGEGAGPAQRPGHVAAPAASAGQVPPAAPALCLESWLQPGPSPRTRLEPRAGCTWRCTPCWAWATAPGQLAAPLCGAGRACRRLLGRQE